MEKLIICDIDGCLNSGKGVKFDLETIQKIRNQLLHLREQSGIYFTLNTGRPQPYAEAIASMLNISLPLICEHGAVIYDPCTDKSTVLIDDNASIEIEKAKKTIRNENWYDDKTYIETGKEYTFSLVGSTIIEMSENEILEFVNDVRLKLTSLNVNVTYTNASIDVFSSSINKGSAIEHLFKVTGIRPSSLIGIGDSLGDLSFLNLMDISMCPSNAGRAVIDSATYTASKPYAEGTLELIKSKWIVT